MKGTVAVLIVHFQAGHRVVWYTTMIDEYWKDHSFDGVGKNQSIFLLQ